MTSLFRVPSAAVVLVLLVALLAACGGDDDPSDSSDAAAGGGDASGVEVSGDLGSKPSITLPGGDPPTDLKIVDLVEGDGDEAAAGATVTAHYVGVSWLNDGGEFDASWNGGQAIPFSLAQVIPGWTEGIPGMKVGGRRLLIIPPEQAYGANPPSPAIAANDTLVFVVDLEATE